MSQSVLNITLWFVSFVFAIGMWYYTLWLTIAFFKRRKNVPKHYIIWLLVSVLLAVKAFAFHRFRMRWPFVSCFSRYWRRRFWCPISSVRRG